MNMMNGSGRGNTVRNRKQASVPLEKPKGSVLMLEREPQSPYSTREDEILSIILSDTSDTEISQMSVTMGRESVKKDEGRLKKIFTRTISSILMVRFEETESSLVFQIFHSPLILTCQKYIRLEFL
jgi:hypothetical protein